MAYPWTSGEVLTAADLNAYAGLVLVKTQTVGTAVSSVTVTNVFSSTFDNYRVIIEVRSSTSTGSDLSLRLDNVSTSYYGSLLRDLYTGGLTGYVRTNNGSSFAIGQIDTGWAGASSSVDIFRPNINTVTMIAGNYFGRGYSGMFSGGRDTAVHTGLTVLVGSGTMTGGTIRVYGYNNG